MSKRKTLSDLCHVDGIKSIKFLEQFNFSFNSAYYYELDSTWACQSRVIQDSMIYFFLSGHCRVTIKNESHECEKGSFVFMPDNYPQSWSVLSDSKEPIRLIVLHFDVANAWNVNLFKSFESMFAKLDFLSYWEKQFLHFISLFNKQKDSSHQYGNALFKSLLAELVLNGFKVGADQYQMDSRIRKILEFIHDHYQKEISVEDLANIARLSSVQLRKIFNKEVGINPKEYIYTYRLKQAVTLLKYSNLSIKEISYNIGFKNDHYFHFLFKKNYQFTPSEYREKELNENSI